VAGNGGLGYGGDNGAAASAKLYLPESVAVDGAGNLFISDTVNQRVREVNSSGIITTIAGNGTQGYSGDEGPAISASLNSPAGLAVDASGNVHIADEANNVIRKVSVSGLITTVAGNGRSGYSGDNGPATSAGLAGPSAVKLDGAGNLYIADAFSYRIRKVANGIITTIAGSPESAECYTEPIGPQIG
jgi:trimeric autotransporter adhesin